ncbi:MAG: fumarylacetoacetate hydrolase family protein [Bacteroidota bacterium]|nr:fumarylacetoacetate hydrolase family protein [Bacteroidota bacterium]
MKIICIGRNFHDHAKEMYAKPEKDPIFFLKADSCLQRDNRIFFIPDFSNNLHYECEIVLRISRVGKGIAEKFSHRYYDAVTVGIDFTARDLQVQCKAKGLPWEISKSFDQSARLGKWLAVSDFENPQSDISFWLKQNEIIVQSASSADMIFKFDALIAYLSKFMTLKIGDLIYTGTPAGVGPVSGGDRLEAGIGDESLLKFSVR